MDFLQYITDNSLILIPVLYIIGTIIKNTVTIKDKFIPVVLLFLGIVGAYALMGISVSSTLQGILVTGATVYTNQLIKQTTKIE